MPIPLIAAAAIAAGATGALKTGFGISQQAQAKKMQERNRRPDYEIQDEFYENRSLAQSMAQGGMDEASLSFYGNQAERGLTAGIDAALQGGGSVNTVNSMLDQYQQNLGSIAVRNSEIQRENIRNLWERNMELAGQKVQAWAINKYEPYKDTARAAAQMRDAGIQNMFGGLSDMTSAAASYAMADNYADMNQSGGAANAATTGNPVTASQVRMGESAQRATVRPTVVPPSNIRPPSIPYNGAYGMLYDNNGMMTAEDIELTLKQYGGR